MPRYRIPLLSLSLALAVSCSSAQITSPHAQTASHVQTTSTTNPATPPGDIVRFPSVEIDRHARKIRVECQALAIDAPLEFLCVSNGGPEHEAALRSPAKPSHIHAGLLMLGQEPGSPMTYSDAKKTWSAPFGPPLRISVEFKDVSGKLITLPATKLMRHVRSHDTMKEFLWIFAGSHQREDGAYLADLTGYVVSLVNFEHTLIDVPRLASASNDTLEWAMNPEIGLQQGQSVTMILEPVMDAEPSTDGTLKSEPSVHGETVDGARTWVVGEVDIVALRAKWEKAVAPHQRAIKDAAKTHFEVITELRKRQQALIDEADQLQRLIDELEKRYGEMTTPKPQ